MCIELTRFDRKGHRIRITCNSLHQRANTFQETTIVTIINRQTFSTLLYIRTAGFELLLLRIFVQRCARLLRPWPHWAREKNTLRKQAK